MRSSSAPAIVVAIIVLTIAAAAIPVLAQDAEQPAPSTEPAETAQGGLERSVGTPLEGIERSDGTIVLADADFCSYLMGEVLGADELTYRRLIDRTKKQKKAKRAAFRPFSDEATIERCSSVLDAFRTEAPEGDTLPSWARGSAVVPAAFAGLLPPDLLADPLAEPADIGDGARTTGFGDATTAPFVLWGGAYYVEVDARVCDTWSGTIRSISDPTLEAAVVDDTTYLYGVPTGNYFWDIDAPACDWSVDIVVFEVPPDPTPTPVPKTEVPRLIGPAWQRGAENPDWLTPAAAAEALIEAGLTVNICQVVRDPFVAQDRIAFQDPPGGTLVEPGSSIRVHVTWPSSCTELPLSEGAQVL